MPSAVAASTGWPVTRAPCIATCRLIAIAALDEFSGLSRMATRVAVGATLCSISTSLPLRSVLRIETPVMLCPGRPRLSTKPLPTGSLDAAMTIGIVAVAFCAALITGVSPATMTSTLRCTTSAASSARRPTSPPPRPRRQRGEAADLAAREPPFDREVAPFDVTELAHAQRERAEAAAFERLGALRQRHESHAPTALLLREGARPRADRRKCDRRNE